MSGTRMAFEKWEGLGNDFVLVEEEPSAWSDERVRAVCDRRRGVGADGVLFVDRGAGASAPPSESGLPALPTEVRAPRMIVRNADGSRPEMCGNGIRCVAGYLAARGIGSGALTIESDAGPRRCDVRGGGAAFDVAVEMGAARIEGTLMVVIDGRAHAFTRVDVGNPHAISFEPYDDAEVDRVGSRVATFPAAGTNVELCRLVRGERPRVDVVVWERGVGRTLACGTGACAVAAAACAAGFFAFGAEVPVRLPGGELLITVAPGSFAATMRGPARRVFTGNLESL